MFDVCRIEREIGGKNLSIETGKIARQAAGAVMVQYGETLVLVAMATSAPRFDDIDFFPLSVDYREKRSAAGKFPGGFFKREGRPTTKETLTARMIDRPIRPLFPDGYFQEVQVMANVLSYDGENDPDVLAMIGASAALTISKVPFMGPTGACRVSRVDGEFVVNPTQEQRESSDMNLLLGGRKEAINMIEVDSKEVGEDVIADAVAKAHETVGVVCDMIEEMRAKVGVEKVIPLAENDEELFAKIKDELLSRVYDAKQIADKQERKAAVNEIFAEAKTNYCEGDEPVYCKAMIKRMLHEIEGMAVKKLLVEGKRADGRAFDQVRPIECEVGILPRNHGSALFSRGDTQALISITLGTVRDAQMVDGLVDECTQDFMLHYNFPAYSVGEVRPVRGPGRREIGHGALAEKSLEQVRPDKEDFAYTIRVISDITGSNGSSSMASVCGGTLALMDAGVPIKNPVAGISIGLISDDNGKYELITDILGEEDHFGEMDFKVSGTVNGINAIQLDIKAEGLAHNIMVEALARAKKARLDILDIMNKTISEPRAELSEYAPKMISVKIDPEFIGKLIGPGGKMIKKIQEETETTIEIEEDGTVFISSVGGDGYLKAKATIEAMTQPPKVGKIYDPAKVVSVKDFGVFVEIIPGIEGLCHISELSDGYVKNVEDVCKNGDMIPVKLILIDDQGRLKLSRKAALAELGQTDKTEVNSSKKE
ncbi:polyribonucleotide nucleotidyltransferase [Planctomycetota bacterium]